jgi:hypothetical protein
MQFGSIRPFRGNKMKLPNFGSESVTGKPEPIPGKSGWRKCGATEHCSLFDHLELRLH